MTSRPDFRIRRQSSAPVVEAELWTLIEPAWDRLASDLGSTTFADLFASWLTPGQLAYVSTHLLDCEVRNGGFSQFLSNTSGALARQARDGFMLLGASRTSALVDEVLTRIPGGYDADHAYRRTSIQRLRALPGGSLRELDERYYALCDGEERLAPLLVAYVERSPQDFFIHA